MATSSASRVTAGIAEYARVPAGWIVPLPGRPDAARGDGRRDGRLHGRPVGRPAGGQRAEPGDGPVLVTGASGGVGRTALAILVERGYEAGRRPARPTPTPSLVALGAAGILSREEVTAESPRPLESERWAAAVDCVGAATLPYILRTLKLGWGRRRQRQHERGAALDDGLPVHPPRRRPARDRLRPGPDRRAAPAVGPDRRGPPAAGPRGGGHGGRARRARAGPRRDPRRAGRGRWIVRDRRRVAGVTTTTATVSARNGVPLLVRSWPPDRRAACVGPHHPRAGRALRPLRADRLDPRRDRARGRRASTSRATAARVAGAPTSTLGTWLDDVEDRLAALRARPTGVRSSCSATRWAGSWP